MALLGFVRSLERGLVAIYCLLLSGHEGDRGLLHRLVAVSELVGVDGVVGHRAFAQLREHVHVVDGVGRPGVHAVARRDAHELVLVDRLLFAVGEVRWGLAFRFFFLVAFESGQLGVDVPGSQEGTYTRWSSDRALRSSDSSSSYARCSQAWLFRII